MSSSGNTERTSDVAAGGEAAEEYVRVPAVIDAHGDKVVTLYDEFGRPHNRLVAEVVLESFVGPRPPGHTAHFRDGNRLNCALSNLEWVPAEKLAVGDDARAKAAATRRRADAMRERLRGRQHSDSAELVAEDRVR